MKWQGLDQIKPNNTALKLEGKLRVIGFLFYNQNFVRHVDSSGYGRYEKSISNFSFALLHKNHRKKGLLDTKPFEFFQNRWWTMLVLRP